MNNISRTETHNGYNYEVYDNGSVRATGQIQNEKAERNGYIQRTAGGASRQETDHGGHLVPASQNGTSDSINISAQNAKVNTRDVRAVEREESKAVNNGATIETERIAVCDIDPDRPSAYIINDHVIMPDGSEHDIHHSFTNEDMSQFDKYTGLDNAQDSYNDVAKEMGYSKEEYEQILTESENYDYSDYGEGWHSSTPTATTESDSSSDTASWFQDSENNESSEDNLTDSNSDENYDFDNDSDSETL